MSKPIESYGLIGDCETAALVGLDGSIDWLCWPRFDSDSTFGALLGTPEHGRWLIAPVGCPTAAGRRYREGTLILETRFVAEGGEVTVIDFMPPRGANSDLVRLVCGVRGRVAMQMELIIRFGYGRIVPWVRKIQDESGPALQAVAGPDMVVLHTPVPVRGENMHTVAQFEVSEAEVIPFVLTYGPSHAPPPRSIDPETALRETKDFWTDWSCRCGESLELPERLGEEASEAVVRSLITLKALTYAPTGGTVAAATTSLPERIGGERNWDYRFCWLRDATITLLALMDAGYFDEAQAWRDWLLRAVAGSPDQIQIMYGIAGERRLSEWEVPWLPGYAGSLPVRVGNAAHDQLQLDVFGEVMDALHQGRIGGLPENEPAWALERALLDRLEQVWREPDEGIWEVRGERQHFTHSKVMAWVAFDRCIRSAEDFGMPGEIERWRRLRDEIHADVCANGYNHERGSFVQAYGKTALDASLLLLPTLGFLPAADPRYRGTVAAIERELLMDGFVRRYDTSATKDGLSGEEGAFLACSFWLADAYLMLGRTDEAWALFRRLLAVRNDVGLLAEEYDPRAGRQLGNVPQAFSHMALVNTALRLAKTSRPEERAPAAAGQTDGGKHPAHAP
jgi:GH15 family glucan-1,4-alpha-glucosidase